MDDSRILVTVSGRDRPGEAAALFAELDRVGAEVVDIEQVEIHGRLLLGVLVATGDEPALRKALAETGRRLGLSVEAEPVGAAPAATDARAHVTVLAERLPAAILAKVFGRIAGCGASMSRIVQLSRWPVVTYELEVSGGDAGRLREELAAEAVESRIDIAVQRAGLHRRAKRLVVLDVDSTLIRDEVIDLLAEEAGCAEQVSRITEATMAGEMDFEESVRARVALLGGLDAGLLDTVRRKVRLTPGARTLVRTLRRLGCEVALVSGGFTAVIDPLAAQLHIRHVAANELEVADGRLTGKLLGPVVDRAGKADALERFAAEAGVPLSQTVAVGDGANDLDMLARAGLGVAFNAKPVLRAAADATLSVPYLDAILFLLGITHEEVAEANDEERTAGPAPA